MKWFVVIQWFDYLGRRIRLWVTSLAVKDLEILYLWQQLLVLQRHQKRGPVIYPYQKRLLVLVGMALRRINQKIYPYIYNRFYVFYNSSIERIV
ncbi:MAG: hypothetical protein K8L99_16075 [Anaerolineae bacterium]|nr:hypothetical protein [Anaerolineae bacterium]